MDHLFLFCIGSISAEETKFYVTRNTFPLGEESYAVFELDMASRFSIPQKYYSNSDVSVTYAGSEENTTIINFQVFRKRLLKFRIQASKQGMFTLPTLSIEVNGNMFSPPPLKIQVLEKSKIAKRGSFLIVFFILKRKPYPKTRI